MGTSGGWPLHTFPTLTVSCPSVIQTLHQRRCDILLPRAAVNVQAPECLPARDRSMTSPESSRRLGAIQLRCYIHLQVWCMCRAMHCIYNGGRPAIPLQYTVTREGRVGLHVIYTNPQIFISPTIMAYSRPFIYPKNVFNNVLL